MRDFAAILRRELELLEAQIAADPRLRKVQKLRELLAIYEEGDSAAADGGATASPGRLAALPAPPGERARPRGLRWIFRRLMRPAGSATVARSRLVAISQSNHWANASPAWLQLQKDASGRPLSYENVFGPGQVVVSAATVLQAAPRQLEQEVEGAPDTGGAPAPSGAAERRPKLGKPIARVPKVLKTA